MRRIHIASYLLLFLFVSGCTHEQIIPNTLVRHNTCVFTYQSNRAKTVNLVGSFNNWDPVNLPMRRTEEKTWVISIALPDGVYYYQFVIDGKTWVVPPHADAYEEDGFGGKNGVVIIINGFKKDHKNVTK